MRGVAFSEAEEKYIWAHHKSGTNAHLSKKMFFIFGIDRTAGTIRRKIQALHDRQHEDRLKKNRTRKIQTRKPPVVVKARVRRITSPAVISTIDLMRAMDGLDYSVQKLARTAKLPEALILEMVTMSGVPHEYAARLGEILKIEVAI